MPEPAPVYQLNLTDEPEEMFGYMNGRILARAGRSDGRTEFKARMVRAGRIRNADDSPGRFVIPEAAIMSAINEGKFDGIGVFADHPSL